MMEYFTLFIIDEVMSGCKEVAAGQTEELVEVNKKQRKIKHFIVQKMYNCKKWQMPDRQFHRFSEAITAPANNVD